MQKSQLKNAVKIASVNEPFNKLFISVQSKVKRLLCKTVFDAGPTHTLPIFFFFLCLPFSFSFFLSFLPYFLFSLSPYLSPLFHIFFHSLTLSVFLSPNFYVCPSFHRHSNQNSDAPSHLLQNNKLDSLHNNATSSLPSESAGSKTDLPVDRRRVVPSARRSRTRRNVSLRNFPSCQKSDHPAFGSTAPHLARPLSPPT